MPSSGPVDRHSERQNSESIALVVVTHNSAGALPPLLNTVSHSEIDRIAECVIVDNASSDSTLDLVTGRLPSATIIANSENYGFATAVNQGVKATSSNLVLLANPDSQWQDGAVSHLAELLDHHKQTAAVCPRLIFPNGIRQSSIRKFPTHSNIWFSRQSPLRFLQSILPSRFAYTLPDPPGATCVEAIAATFMLMRREAFVAVGGMDDGYFLYVEDTDICKRWHDHGYEVWIEPNITVTHDWQGGSGRSHGLHKNHRDGIRRYFRTHHADKTIRNAVLNVFLTMVDWSDRVWR